MFTRVILLLFLLWGQGSQITGALSKDEIAQVRIVELRVPAHAREGGSALLGCQYVLKGSELYSLKWYKNEQEFYRYVPQRYPPIIDFKRPGVHVNLSRSSSTVVALENLSRESEGNYTCEVSGEAPYFPTTRSSKYITIHLLPDSGPHVSGLKEQYRLDEIAVINCTSPASRPMAQLKWLVNDELASQYDIHGPWNWTSPNRPDAVETTLQLRFIVAPRHFVGSTMKLKCQATIAPLYQRETNSTHYIELPFTTVNAPLQDDANADHSDTTSISISKHSNVGLFTIFVILLLIV